jgi:hypothetical protein
MALDIDIAANVMLGDRMLVHSWPRICNDHGSHKADEVGVKARQEFLRTLPLSLAVTGRSENSV